MLSDALLSLLSVPSSTVPPAKNFSDVVCLEHSRTKVEILVKVASTMSDPSVKLRGDGAGFQK